MRILDKKAISRRSFLKGGTATALGLTIAGNMVLGKSSAWAASFDNLGGGNAATLIQMARDIYPHDHLADKYYAKVIEGYNAAAAKDAKLKSMIQAELKKINDAAKKKYGSEYKNINRELERVDILKANTSSPLFGKLRGDLVTGIYNNQEVWPKFGYEGASADKGGYINRGFNDINWLDKV
jgi:hypothetical protein